MLCLNLYRYNYSIYILQTTLGEIIASICAYSHIYARSTLTGSKPPTYQEHD